MANHGVSQRVVAHGVVAHWVAQRVTAQVVAAQVGHGTPPAPAPLPPLALAALRRLEAPQQPRERRLLLPPLCNTRQTSTQ